MKKIYAIEALIASGYDKDLKNEIAEIAFYNLSRSRDGSYHGSYPVLS